jgi:5-amino-6-(5-phosphoribosylamino)uracil reductase
MPHLSQPGPSHLDPSVRLKITVILAMSADGKIADIERTPARFGSAADKRHLEMQIAQADAVLFGAGTLQAYGTTLRITNASLLQMRGDQGKPLQPPQIVCSASAALDPQLLFFRQPVPRWLLTSEEGATHWRGRPEFERVLSFYCEAVSDGAKPDTETHTASQADSKTAINWPQTLDQLTALGIDQLAVTGGGALVGSLFAADLVDELWLTVCPLILGGASAPTPVAGSGFLESAAPRLALLSAEVVEDEVFLHYQRAAS